MTLRHLLKTCRYKEVFNTIHKAYYGDATDELIYQEDLGYRSVFKELSQLPSSKEEKEYKIYVSEKHFEPDGEKFIDVSLYCEEESQTYAMDFTPWKDLIDMEITTECSFTPCQNLAHILWELTFYGYSEVTIRRERSKLKELSDRIERGEEKLVPWSEVIKDLDKEKGDIGK